MFYNKAQLQHASFLSYFLNVSVYWKRIMKSVDICREAWTVVRDIMLITDITIANYVRSNFTDAQTPFVCCTANLFVFVHEPFF